MIKCSCCGKEKDESEYFKKSKQCKECTREKRKIRENKKNGIDENVNVLDFTGKYNEEVEEKENNYDVFVGFGNELMVGMFSDTLKQIFKLMSSRMGKHWIIDNDEALSLAKPTINLISKSKFYSTLMDNADIVSLFTALGFIVAPRVMKTVKNNGRSQENDGDRNQSKSRKPDTRTEKTEIKTENNYDDIINEITDNAYGDNETINF